MVQLHGGIFDGLKSDKWTAPADCLELYTEAPDGSMTIHSYAATEHGGTDFVFVSALPTLARRLDGLSV